MSGSQSLSDRDEQFIRRQLQTGRYHDRNEVIHAGLEMLQEFESDLDRWIETELPGRYAELQSDPSQAMSFDDAYEDFQKTRQAELAKAK